MTLLHPREMALNGSIAGKHPRYLPFRGGGRTAALAAGVVVLFAVSVLLGNYTVTIPDFFTIVFNHLTGGPKIPGASFIVMENKLPRTVIATMIGIAFGLAGTLFQRVFTS